MNMPYHPQTGGYKVTKLITKTPVEGPHGPYQLLEILVNGKKGSTIYSKSFGEKKDGEVWQDFPAKVGDEIKINQGAWEKKTDYGPSIKELEQGSSDPMVLLADMLARIADALEKIAAAIAGGK